MSLPTVAQLCSQLGDDLRPAPGAAATSRQITAVHVSELDDPTPFLSGGELLLTTGLSLPREADSVNAYVQRLAGAGAVALAFGLGPVHDRVPPALLTACRSAALSLLIVPPATPFLSITHAYWQARTLTDRLELVDAVSGHQALARAMLAPGPAAEVVRTLAVALRSWVAFVSTGHRVEHVYPLGMLAQATAAVDSAGLADLRDLHSAASFALGDHAVVVFPVPLRDKVIGYLVTGSDHRLSTSERRLMTTATVLLGVEAGRGGGVQREVLSARRAVAELLDLGLAEAAKHLAGRLAVPLPDGPVRVLMVRSARAAADLTDAVLEQAPGMLPGGSPGDHWFVMDAAVDPAGWARLIELDARLVAALSAPVALAAVGQTRVGLARVLAGLPAGSVSLPPAALDSHVEAATEKALEALLAYRRADLVGSLTAYLRHRGGWDAAARELRVHRNTLRHRLDRCRALTDVDLDDPDVAAWLWLHLRARGLA